MRFSLGFCVLFFIFAAAACSSGDSSTTDPQRFDGSTFRDPGPFEAGVTTLTLDDRMIEVWYPVDRADTDGLDPVPYFIREELSEELDGLLPEDVNPPFPTSAFRDVSASRFGPFPLVLFAHGSSSYRNQSTFLTTHLASWGFVVASVDYIERGLRRQFDLDDSRAPNEDLDDAELTRSVVDLVASQNDASGSPLEGGVSTDRIAITGHSAGGGTSIRFGAEPDVVTYIPLSAGFSTQSTVEVPDKPSLWIAGNVDAIVEPDRTETAFMQATAPTGYLLIEDMGHLGPSDICAIGSSGGGVIQIALDADLPIPDSLVRLGSDGCQAEAVDPPDGWPIINHFVTAQLRWAFGIDEEPIGLSDDVADEFPEVTFSYEERL